MHAEELLLDHPTDEISAETDDIELLITFTIPRLCPGTVGPVHDEADSDAEEMLLCSRAAPFLLLSDVSTQVCDPNLLNSSPRLEKPAETCVAEYDSFTFTVFRHCLVAAWSCPC